MDNEGFATNDQRLCGGLTRRSSLFSALAGGATLLAGRAAALFDAVQLIKIDPLKS
jgi:hypothetical protein